MQKFSLERKGYNRQEVDSYIEAIVTDYEMRLSEQKNRIFSLKDELEKKSTMPSDKDLMSSLLTAVERAKVIENSSKNIYELENKKLLLIYSKMEKILQDESMYNDENARKNLLKLIQDSRASLENSIVEHQKNIESVTSTDPIKKLLTKMTRGRVENKDLRPKTSLEKSDYNRYLLEDNVRPNGSNFENIMFNVKNEKKEEADHFDLKEAVNPKEDLEEIMKAFDFYNNKKEEDAK